MSASRVRFAVTRMLHTCDPEGKRDLHRHIVVMEKSFTVVSQSKPTFMIMFLPPSPHALECEERWVTGRRAMSVTRLYTNVMQLPRRKRLVIRKGAPKCGFPVHDGGKRINSLLTVCLFLFCIARQTEYAKAEERTVTWKRRANE